MESVHTTFLRPRVEGANIGVWLGFKHITYVMEEAVLDYFRTINLSQRTIFIEFGSRIEFRYSKIELLKTVNTDDLLKLEIFRYEKDNDLSYRIIAEDVDAKLLFRGLVKVFITTPMKNEDKIPRDLQILSELSQKNRVKKEYNCFKVDNTPSIDYLKSLDEYKKSFIYSIRMPYYYCHYNNLILQSAYIRIVEDAVDRFLDNKGISVGKMLKNKNWIPVVTKSIIEINNYAYIEEDVFVTFTIKDVFKDTLYVSDLSFFIKRDAELIEIASASITHGYSHLTSESEGYMVTFDSKTLKALMS